MSAGPLGVLFRFLGGAGLDGLVCRGVAGAANFFSHSSITPCISGKPFIFPLLAAITDFVFPE